MNPNKEKWILLGILSIIWGSSFILIKKSLLYFTPYEVGSLRVFIAGILLLPIAIPNIKKFPKEDSKWLIIAALSGNFIPMFLFPLAETKISSGIAGIINSLMPVFVILVGGLFWKFKTSKKQIIGVFISFVGVCFLAFSGDSKEKIEIVPIAILLLATLLYAISTTTVKSKLNNIPAKTLSSFVFSFVLLIPSLISLVFSGFFNHTEVNENLFRGLGYVSMLSIFGTGLAMMLNYRLLKISSPLFASTVTLLMPIVAVFWGILDGENFTITHVFGGVIILIGLLYLRIKPDNQ